MKKFTSIAATAVLLLCVASFPCQAQTIDYATTKEKVYVQTSHVFFKPGETIYFKIYVVKASDQTPSSLSTVVYADIINPAGAVVQKLNYRVDNGYAEGSYDLGAEAVGGVYKIRAYTTWMRNENDSSFFTKELTVQKVIAPRVLMKLDFPEKGYSAGDEVAADFSIRNLADQPVRNFGGTYHVSINGNMVHTGNFVTNYAGKAVVTFHLPKELNSTDGLLNITVNYDSYTEAISRSIPIVLHKIDLQCMPEGGTLVEGVSTNMAFKAVNEWGKATDIKGEVWDNEGTKVTTLESYHFGMGRFLFVPERGKTYKVKITSPSGINAAFPLPMAAQDGVIMNMRKENHQLVVRVVSTTDREVKLVGQTKSITYYSNTISLRKGENIVRVDEGLFPVGIAQFTLYTATDLPLAERLCFLNEEKNLQVSITTDKQTYLPREKVTLTIKTMDERGKPVPSNFSLAVVDDKLWSFADDKQDHILSWLLLSSELKGKIEEPQFYFKSDEPKAAPALDLLLMTQGYRYFGYTEYVRHEGRLQFTPDQDNILSGVIVDEAGKAIKATVFLINSAAGTKGVKVVTGTDGVFFFSDIVPGSGYYLLAQAIDKKEKAAIRILQQGTGYNPAKTIALQQFIPGNDLSKFHPLIIAPAEKPGPEMVAGQLNKQLIGAKPNNLEEVVVIGYGAQRKKDITGAIAIINAKEIMAGNNAGFLLQGRVPGLQVAPMANPGASAKIMIRGMRAIAGNQPLFIVDGIPVEGFNVATIQAADIDNITVLKDAAATSLYGARAANGVILIESKKFRNERIRFYFPNKAYYASLQVPFSGTVYSVAKHFYAPRYTSTDAAERNDFRETIYWNPVVQTDSKGSATIQFYNSDASTTFRAIAEGIGFNGKLGRKETTYAVKNALSVDAKIPPYLTVGDSALLPLVIKNNSNAMQQLSITVNAPKEATIGHYIHYITLMPDSSQQLLIPLQALHSLSGIVQFLVEGNSAKEIISLPIIATEKGFPVVETFSGNKNKEHHFDIGKMIPGSLKTELKLFTNLEGQLLDGIQSMLREPHGCFEQTSSCTYPNIYVLKYLRESGKSNPEIEKKALDYIEQGYKRLIGFETAQNGFEWFGKTPPHEALTAYGLMEFTDMQEFISVDKKMLQRTKDFLLRRRDGKGSFNLSTRGYDQFASVPDKVASIYIVYALTQSGLGKEIIAEYQTAVKKALQSNDGYQLNMMALAASNMKADSDYRQLMNAANELFQHANLRSETSVVNSRDASLRVETMSLYALALLREQSPNLGAIATVISKILAEKSYYGYGSTQATVLALKAIVAYSKLIGKVAAITEINFRMNGRNVVASDTMTSFLQEGANDFAVSYKDSLNALPYNLEVAYNTFTPPNSDKAELGIATTLSALQTKVGETVRLQIELTNQKATLQPMAIAKIGIPAGLSIQPWQLKEIVEKNEVAYYEFFDNYLVLYWMGCKSGEVKKINLDLKAEIPGIYKGKASTAYLYYTPEYKRWNDGLTIRIDN